MSRLGHIGTFRDILVITIVLLYQQVRGCVNEVLWVGKCISVVIAILYIETWK